ncbi:hypothetical protein DCS_03536 [Drechmeria coniospora]|uniref:Uncharacterized protein n=1 Tax=Drechmeria coniospora TaxID=98403 RepID=A0A151GHH5_DRECN|nr:hypothetical protein DCS_03536 [Drechmeria coniospora]KYK56536.1 hypothetical protein DCS_03536 [Drechmeria coniospora]
MLVRSRPCTKRSRRRVPDVDSALREISDEALDKLTSLLYLDKTLSGMERTHVQKDLMKRLDGCLLRPTGIVGFITRIGTSIAKYRSPVSLTHANLCLMHKPLDPRVVRKLMVLVARECTVHLNRFRRHRANNSIPWPLSEWLERMDNTTALWLGKDLFMKVFLREAPESAAPMSEMGRCEACILAVVGSEAQMLTDLRAAIKARHTYSMKRDMIRTEPRLLRIIKSWMKLYPLPTQAAMREMSDALVASIVTLRKDARVSRKLRFEYDSQLKVETMMSTTRDGLPVPTRTRSLATKIIHDTATVPSERFQNVSPSETKQTGIGTLAQVPCRRNASTRVANTSVHVADSAAVQASAKPYRHRDVTYCDGHMMSPASPSSPTPLRCRPSVSDVSDFRSREGSCFLLEAVSELSDHQSLPVPTPRPTILRTRLCHDDRTVSGESTGHSKDGSAAEPKASSWTLDSYYYNVAGGGAGNMERQQTRDRRRN